MSEWRVIDSFPSYEASDDGKVRNCKTERILKPVVNQDGVWGVGLMKAGIQFRRSLPLLVATAFLSRPYPTFDTPINLDGDRRNCHVDNLAWRPRWFAVEYNRQFRERYANGIDAPIVDMKFKTLYESSLHCAVANGLLESDVVLSIMNRTFVWPTYQEFALA